jgi:Flp pilus assembly protein TadD
VWHYPFVAFDDDTYIYANPDLTPGLSAVGLRWAFTTFHAANYHPLVWVSFLFDQTAWHLRPGPMHVENVALHAASAVLVFALLLRMTGARWPAAFVAGVFAVHPAHVESVAWVTERKDTLSLFLLLLSGNAYITNVGVPSHRGGGFSGHRWPLKRPPPSGRDPTCPPDVHLSSTEPAGPVRWLAYGVLLLTYALSLLAKSTGVTWAAVLLLLDVWPLRRMSRRAWLEKVPLLALAVGSAVMTTAAQRAGGAVSRLDMVPAAARVGNGVVAYVRYMAEAVWPHDLAAFYRFQWPLPESVIVGSALAMVVATVVALRLGRRRPYVSVGWLWFVGTMVPMLGLVQVGSQSMADRYLYLPMIGLTIIIAWAAAEVPYRRIAFWMGMVALVSLGAAARAQVRTWSDTAALQHRMMSVEGGEAEVNEWLGMKAVAAGDTAGAERHLSVVVRLDPTDYRAAYDLGNLRLRSEHRPDRAVECYARAAAVRPDVAAVQTNWGVALLQMGRPGEAYQHLKMAEQLNPDAYDPHFNLGLMFLSAGNHQAAAAEFAAAVRADPTSAAARAKLAAAGGH